MGGEVDELGKDPAEQRQMLRLGDRLVSAGVLDAEGLARVLQAQKREGGWFGDHCVKLRLVREEDLLRVLAAEYGTRYVTADKLAAFKVADKVLAKLPHAVARKLLIVPLAWDEATRALHVVSAVPPEGDAKRDLLTVTNGRELIVYVSTHMAVEALLKKTYLKDLYAFSWLDGSGNALPTPPPSEPTKRFEEGKRADLSQLERELARFKIAAEFRRRLARERDPAQLPARILAVLFDLFPADGGAILLHKGASLRRSRMPGREVQVSRTILAEVAASGEGVLVGDVQSDPRFKQGDSLVVRSIKSAMAQPLKGPDGPLGVLYLEAVRPTLVFSREEVEQLAELARISVEMLELCEEVAATHRDAASRIHLARFLSPTFVEQARTGSLDVSEAGVRRPATVLVVGIAGLTRLAASETSAIEVLRTANAVLETIADAVHLEGGALDRLGARGVSAIFGVPARYPDDAARALRAASRIAAEATRLLGEGGPKIGLGVHRGEVLWGALGPSRRRDLTAFGGAVDIATKLGYAAMPGEVLVSRPTAALAQEEFTFAERPLPAGPTERVLPVVRLVGPR